LLAGQRVAPPPPTRTRIGLSRAIKLFLSFIWAALRNAPRDWLHRTIADGQTWMARVGQALVGRDSEYQLVVRGRRSDGSLASVEQVDQAVGRVRTGNHEEAHHEDLPRLGLLWRDFFEVGLSLIDGAHRVSAINQPTVGPLPGVVRDTTSVAAPADRAFTGIPAHVAAELGVGAIHPADLYLSEAVLRELDDRSRGSASGLELGRVRESLARWRESVQRRSFAGDFGYQLAARIVELRNEIEGLRATLVELATPVDIDDGFAARQEALARRARMLIWASLLVPVVLFVAHRFNWLSTRGVLLTGLAALLVWVVTLTVMFIIGQARLFRLLNRQANDRGAAEAARANLSAALADLDRVLCAYGSYRHWAAILGTLVTRPFGAPTPARTKLRMLTGPLPRSVQVGSIEPTPAALDGATAALRPVVFVEGWLDTSYQTFLATAQSVQTATLTGDQPVESLFTELSRRDSDSLAHLAQLIGTRGLDPAARDRFWENAAAQLAQPNLTAVRAKLLGNIAWSGDRAAELDAIGDPLGQPGRESINFSGELLVADARSQGAHVVQAERGVRLNGPGIGLGQNLSVAEFGRSFSSEGMNIALAGSDGRPAGGPGSDGDTGLVDARPGRPADRDRVRIPGTGAVSARRL
jgi:hypothetical protein